jgi:hypothetical protein
MKKLLIFGLLVTLGVSLHSLLYYNDLIGAFPEGVDKAQIENNVVEGAVHFFMSKSHADLLFKEYERSAITELDKSQSLIHVENAIAELKISMGKYQNAADTGKRIGYNQEKLQYFKNFDYGEFAAQNHLNSQVAAEVSTFLSKGDIVGVYNKNIDKLSGISATLDTIRDTLENGDKPDIHILWTLVQQYSETLLFGNYTTMMGTSAMAGSH